MRKLNRVFGGDGNQTMKREHGSGRRNRLRLGAVVAVAVGAAWTAKQAHGQTTIISDNFQNGTPGNSLVGMAPDTTDVPGSTYQFNGALAYPATYTSASTSAYPVSASVGADSGVGLATGISTTVDYQVSITFNDASIGDTAGDEQRGEGLGFFSTLMGGYNDYHGVGDFTGVVVSPGGDVRLVSVGGQGGNEPTVTLVSDYQLPSYDATANHTLSYTANTSSGFVSNVVLDGTSISLPDTTPLFSPGSTAYVGFTASGNGGGQTAIYNNFTVAESAVTGPPPASAWNITGSGDWNVATNWTTGIPNGIDAEADFFATLSAAHTVYSDIPVIVGKINFNNPNEYVIAGAGTLTLQTSSGSASIIVQQGTQKINLPLTIASNTAINVASGSTLLISDPVTIDPGVAVTSTGTVTYQSTITVGSGASVAFSSSTSAAALALPANASASAGTSSGTRTLLQFDSLTIGTGSSLNLSNNDMIVHGGSLSTVTALLKSGYNQVGGANWSGQGISSTAAASNSTHLTALGVMAAPANGTYDGAAVTAGDVIVRYTYYGDANLDGKVDGSDYSLIDAGYASRGALSGWANGDFNYDGVIDGSDYALIDNAFNNQGSQIGAASAALVASATAQVAPSAVPEPASLGFIAAGAVMLAGRRRVRASKEFQPQPA